MGAPGLDVDAARAQHVVLSRDGAANGRIAPAGLRHPSHRTGLATFMAPGSPLDGLLLAWSMYGLMARPAERDQITECVRLHAFGVVDSQTCPCATLLTLHAVTHLCSESPFDDFEGFAAIAAAGPNNCRVDALVWAGCSLWMVTCCRGVAGQVGVREAGFALLSVALAVKFLSGGEPLVRFQRVTAFAHLSMPADSAMEPLGFASDELALVTSLVLFPQPVEVAELTCPPKTGPVIDS